jgi:hypothetical protein
MNSRRHRVITGACVLALMALGLMVWSLFDPRPVPVVVAMSIGQVLGTLSLGAFVYVALVELRAQLARAPLGDDQVGLAAGATLATSESKAGRADFTVAAGPVILKK